MCRGKNKIGTAATMKTAIKKKLGKFQNGLRFENMIDDEKNASPFESN